jgi:Protein of unknown function (DUF3489)
MTKLSDTQAVILANASQSFDGNVLPLPGSLRGGAQAKVIGALLKRGLIEERTIDSIQPPDASLNRVWRQDDDGRAILLYITKAGLAAIGCEPEDTDAPEADAAPDTTPDGATDGQDAGTATEDATPAEGAPAGDTVADAAEPKARKVRTGTKQAQLIEMLRSAEGASIDEIVAATGWQPHTVRGAIAGALKKKLGLDVTSDKDEKRGRVYRVA